MMRSLTRLIQVIGIIIIPFAAMMFWNQYHIIGLSERVSVENTAAVIGMIPEGLYLLITIALMASTIRLAQRGTLVHDMKCIETLARVDVICVDKTGTITQPDMEVGQLIPLADGSKPNTEALLRNFVCSMTGDNETMKALKARFRGAPAQQAERVLGFSSAWKFSAVDFGAAAYVLGAPEIVLGGSHADVRALADQQAGLGQRVLVFAAYRYTRGSGDDVFDGGHLGGQVSPIALITLANPVRPNAKETFEYFAEQGVEVKVISGDNPLTVAKTAELAGIPGADKTLDCSTVRDKKELTQAATEYTVFGRVTPEQKRLLIRAMKKAGNN